jgi:hypothetical protein
MEDLVVSIMSPGYIGRTAWQVVNVSLALFCLLIGYRAWSNPSTFNMISLFVLIPAGGLIVSVNWYVDSLQSAVCFGAN